MRIRSLSVLAGSLVVAGSLFAPLTALANAAPSRSAAPQTVQACVSGQLVNWLNTSGNGYAGGVDYELQFTNISPRECSLYGFPGVSAVNLAGHRIGNPATRGGAAGRTVAVAPGATARVQLQVVDTGNFPRSTCRPVTAAGLRVYAAGLRTSDVIPFPVSVCSDPHTVSISVGATTG
jgi:hypothetical protein